MFLLFCTSPVALHRYCVETFEETVTFSRLYGLTVIKKDLRLQVGLFWYRNVRQLQVQTAHDDPVDSGPGVNSIDDCVVLDQCFLGLPVADRAARSLSSASGPAARTRAGSGGGQGHGTHTCRDQL